MTLAILKIGMEHGTPPAPPCLGEHPQYVNYIIILITCCHVATKGGILSHCILVYLCVLSGTDLWANCIFIYYKIREARGAANILKIAPPIEKVYYCKYKLDNIMQ